jgi:hypothetical protein
MTEKEQPNEKPAAASQRGASGFRVTGRAQLEAMGSIPNDVKLMAYLFDGQGQLLGKALLDREGSFTVPVKLKKPADVELFIAPEADSKTVRTSATYSQKFSAEEWKQEGRLYYLQPELFIPRNIWWPWWPMRICVSGHVRKVVTEDSTTHVCPVPYVKVEIFDVDREGCWWPYIYRWWDLLLDRPVIRVPDLLKERIIPRKPIPLPDPIPDPIGPISRLDRTAAERLRPGELRLINPQPEPPRWASPAERVAINPQPEPPGSHFNLAGLKGLGPQPEPPDMPQMAISSTSGAMTRVGEVSTLEPQLAARLDKLTLTSTLAPWILFPLCFYSKALVCETYTDCDGYFRCCFTWWPWHFRRGRLRFDARPDIIIKVTQIIDGVETVIYMDPYTSTRWNVTNAHIDLFLDNEEVVCGPGCAPDPDLDDSQAAVLRLGADEVWKINQADGMYTVPPVSNAAFGHTLYIRGDFSANLKTGSPKRYYKLSYAKATPSGGVPADSAFTAIKTPLTALRAPYLGTFESYLLGPQPVGTEQHLYEVQDTTHWWMMPWDTAPWLTLPGGMVLGIWHTNQFENDQGTYYLRFEVFDQTGTKMTTIQFPNHGGDGTGTDPDPVPIVTNHLDLKVHLDNRLMAYELGTPAINDCGVVPWATANSPAFQFHVHAEQPHGRVHSWELHYTRGTNPTRIPLGSASFDTGTSPVDTDISGAPLLVPALQSTCAFALILDAWSHVRVNYGFHHYGDKIYAIAVEKCPLLPIVATED